MVTNREWSIEEGSGKVVADKWLHHLRFTLTEAPAAPSLSNKQSQPDAPSSSHVIFIHEAIHFININSQPSLTSITITSQHMSLPSQDLDRR
jgi:hypothetical protein